MIYATYSTGEIIAKRIGNNSLIDPEKIIEIQADCDELPRPSTRYYTL